MFKRRRAVELKYDCRSNVMLEFAIVGPIFFLLLFFVFDTAYTLFLQGVVDTSLQATARAVQVGTTAAQAATTGQGMASLLCGNSLSLVNCNDLFVRVERINETTCPGVSKDVYDDTSGSLPATGGVLQLSLYSSQNSSSGFGTTPTTSNNCDSNKGYCVPGGSGSSANSEFIVLSAVYVTPSFLGGLAPSTLTYNGSYVRALFSQSAFITENYTSNGLNNGAGVTPC